MEALYCPGCLEVKNIKVKAYAFTPDLADPCEEGFYIVCFECYKYEIKQKYETLVEWFKLQ